jgi:hypothetical protein
MGHHCLLFFVAFVLVWPGTSWGREVIPFSGIFDPRAWKAEMFFGRPGSPDWSLTVVRVAPQQHHLTIGLSHIQTPLGDMATVLTADVSLVGDQAGHKSLVGEVSSRYTILDYKPIHDLKFKFAVQDQRLQVNSFGLGAFSGEGVFDLVGDRRMDAVLRIQSLDLEDVAVLIQPKVQTKTFPMTGVVTGEIRMRGEILRPQLNGRLAAYNGRFKAMGYETIFLDFEGAYPLVRLTDIVLTTEEGLSFQIKGVVDLGDLANLGTQIRHFERVPTVSSSGPRPEWVFMRQHSERDSRTEMKYFLMQDDRGDTSAVVGVQKTIGF